MLDKEALLSLYLVGPLEGEGQHRSPQFVWPFQNWELEFIDNFLEVFYDNLPASSHQDQEVCMPSKKWVFQVEPYYNALYLLLQCSMATNIWSFAFTLFGLAWVTLKSVLDLLECWEGEFQCHRGANMWWALPLCVMWILLYESNRWVFDGVESPTFAIKKHILWSLFDWMHALGGNHLFVICLNLLILHIFYSLKGTWTIIILFPFSVSNKFCTYMYKTSLNFFFDGKTTLNLILLIWAGNIWAMEFLWTAFICILWKGPCAH